MTSSLLPSVSVVGATGYAGGELVALLSRHAGVSLGPLYSGPGGARVPFSRLHRSLSGRAGPDALPLDIDALLEAEPAAVFLATPNEVSADVAPLLLDWDPKLKVIDLSGAFRLARAEDYPAWYGFPHPRPDLLAEAVYGLPEWMDDRPGPARLVANPGCYPTSVLLAIKPLLPLLDETQAVVCDCKSGSSGAGKRDDVAFSFSEVAGNLRAYGAGTHRHEPEMRQQLGLSPDAPFVFVPHLLPAVRGVLSTVHVGFERAVDPGELEALYRDSYGASPLIDVYPHGALPDLNAVVGTPRAAIGYSMVAKGRRAVVVCVIDNLLKGAASQAVQNLNRLFGFAEAEGLS